jgi:tagatose 1,6-diphosphate aldolase GatY/KbaY
VRASFRRLVSEAAARGAAVGAFTCYNLETATGVLRAAEERGRGVILLVGERSFRAPGGDLLAAALVAAAERAPAPACVQLDHVSDVELIEAAFELGFGAVMADGSRLPFEGNAELVRTAVELARRAEGDVEAELGGIEGDEDVAAAVAAGALTDPDEAAALVERTGAACLAVSIGNVHGDYRQPPALDWPRLEAIRARVAGPLSLHGASGLPDADVQRAISLGVAKINLNTELRHRYLETTAARLPAARDGANVIGLNRAQTEAVAEAVARKLETYECAPARR